VKSNAAFSNPEAFSAGDAFVKQLNANGGINGHPIKIEDCDSDLNPNKETACFQQAVTDKVAAVVGSFTIFASLGGMKLLEQAGIPYVGGNGVDLSEFTSKMSFPADGGEVGWYQGEASLMKEAGVKNPGLLYCDTAACTLSKTLAQTYWKSTGGGTIKTVEAPLASPQYTSQAALVSSGGVDGVMLASATQAIPKMVSAVRQAGMKGPIALIDPFVTGDTLKAMGAQAEGLLVAGLLAPLSQASSNPGVANFIAAMNANDPSAQQDGISENSWNGFDLFAQVAKTIQGDVTSASLLKALQTTTSGINLGLTGPWTSPDAQGTPPNATYPRLTADSWSYIPEKITGGALVATGDRVSLAG
jgi:branched-chain amino acid transport system substrate-binding protein